MNNEVFKTAPDSEWNDPLHRNIFIEKVSDLAFGDDTIERGYSMEEVINRLKLFCEFTAFNDASFEEFSHKWEQSSGEESC